MDKYDINYQCSYFNEIDTETETITYHIDLLNAFKIDNEEENFIDIILDIQKYIYEDISNNIDMKEIASLLSNRYMLDDPLFGFTILFSYDYFYLTHTCICEYYKNNGKINNNLIDNLKNKIC